jgi:hypothetical protein
MTVNLISSNITIEADKTATTVGTSINIIGIVTPLHANVNVTLDIRTSNGTRSWNATVKTDENGGYSYVWTPNATGIYRIKASWQGDPVTMQAESDEVEVNVQARGTIPIQQYIIAAVAVLAIFIILVAVIRKTRKK